MLKFSIIIPTLNEQDAIVACLSALQPWRGLCEIIVADGGSSDDTRRLAGKLADQVVACPQGRARQMNAGASRAGGDVLLFLHADTALPADALDRIRERFENGARWGRFDIRLNDERWMFKIIADMMNLRSRLTGIATGDQAIFVDKATFDSAGRYPEIALMEDVALSKILKRTGPPACLKTQAVSSARRWRQQGIIRTILLMWSLRLGYFFGADPDDLARRYDGET